LNKIFILSEIIDLLFPKAISTHTCVLMYLAH